ncbi:hypothetical protein BACCIP111883_02868 [Sutcliffiella rhizosphaerae]|uniref:Uncharacterized protein n=1 Tax=Sutcliffiella rhizosphaerae TaxID=2880967 RepID=A0ABM8YPZ8_9BACI|nr:hypothetical protein BACCIP111883_02868 [Sutcliffiella rhizosphaerae]
MFCRQISRNEPSFVECGFFSASFLWDIALINPDWLLFNPDRSILNPVLRIINPEYLTLNPYLL